MKFVLVHHSTYVSLSFWCVLKNPCFLLFFKFHMTKFSSNKGHKYNTRLQHTIKNKSPSVKVEQLEYLEKDTINRIYKYRLYCVSKRFRKPGKLDWRIPKGKVVVRGLGYIPESPVLKIKFEKPVVPNFPLSYMPERSFWV